MAEARILSPQIEKFMKENPFPDVTKLPLPQLRKAFNERQKAINANAPTYGLLIENESIEYPGKAPIPIRIYRAPDQKEKPVFAFFHGGGFVLGDLETLECFCREVAHFADCTVISIDYPLAPENPFPAAPEAAFHAVKWVGNNLRRWHGTRLFLAGSSAGATLATVICLMLTYLDGPAIAGQILLSPATDCDFNTPSYIQNAVGYILTREFCIWFLEQYVSDKNQYTNPLVSPLRWHNFENLPPLLMVVADLDPFRDEEIAYAEKYKAANVPTLLRCYKGMTHGFATMPLDLEEKQDVMKWLSTFMKTTT